jgi:hypothetical protein
MTSDQIVQLRTLLTKILNNDLPRIHTAYAGGPDRVDIKIANARWDCSQKLLEALTILPCETCKGTGDSKTSVVDDLSGGIVDTDIPRPDCK